MVAESTALRDGGLKLDDSASQRADDAVDELKSRHHLRPKGVNILGLQADDHVIWADHHLRRDNAAAQRTQLPCNLGRPANLGPN
jgi:hypothetical protein